MRRTVQQLLANTNFSQSFGSVPADLPTNCAMINEIIERLIYAGGHTGWWGGWAKVVFSVTQDNPYITLPPLFARAINLTVCKMGVRIQNEFYEMLEASIGLQPPASCSDWCGALEGFERGVFTTLVDLPVGGNPQYLKVYLTDPGDAGKQMLFVAAKDQNGTGIYDTSPTGPANGAFMRLAWPFSTYSTSGGVPVAVSAWNAIVKDQCLGEIVLKAVDSVTGEETALSRYLPWETNPAYRRYYINALPRSCCDLPAPDPSVQVEAMCKYEFVPVSTWTDQLIIGNFPALIEEAQSVRNSRMEDPDAGGRAARHHKMAIKLLQDEMGHYLGKLQPALNFAPFGTAKLARQSIGSLR